MLLPSSTERHREAVAFVRERLNATTSVQACIIESLQRFSTGLGDRIWYCIEGAAIYPDFSIIPDMEERRIPQPRLDEWNQPIATCDGLLGMLLDVGQRFSDVQIRIRLTDDRTSLDIYTAQLLLERLLTNRGN